MSEITKIPTKRKRTKDAVIKFIDKVIDQLDQMNLALVKNPWDLIQQLLHFPKHMSKFKTLFRRTDVVIVEHTVTHRVNNGYIANYDAPLCGGFRRVVQNKIYHIHQTSVAFAAVVSGNTKIWTEQEKKVRRDAVNAENSPRGFDINGDKETQRVRVVFDDHCPEINETFDIEETVRGSLTDMIFKSKIDNQVGFATQNATARQTVRGTFDFQKLVNDASHCLQLGMMILLVAMVGNRLVGLYAIFPTQSAKKKWAKLAEVYGSMRITPSMLNKADTRSVLYKEMEEYRYLHKDFEDGVSGKFKKLDNFSGDFLEALCDNYHTMASTPDYWESLFKDDGSSAKRTEWAGNVSFTKNVANNLEITEKTNHGERGDKWINGGDFLSKDERKVLAINGHSPKSHCWMFRVRGLGHEGLHPSHLHTVTVIIRKDRSKKHPNQPSDFIAIGIFPVLTGLGEIAVRPDNPSAFTVPMTCDTANHSEYMDIAYGKIADDAFPAHMCEIVIVGNKKKLRIKNVFYYDDLNNSPEKRTELRNLYKLFAERTASENAITTYENAVTAELIDKEKKAMKKKMTKVVTTVVEIETEDDTDVEAYT